MKMYLEWFDGHASFVLFLDLVDQLRDNLIGDVINMSAAL